MTLYYSWITGCLHFAKHDCRCSCLSILSRAFIGCVGFSLANLFFLQGNLPFLYAEPLHLNLLAAGSWMIMVLNCRSGLDQRQIANASKITCLKTGWLVFLPRPEKSVIITIKWRLFSLLCAAEENVLHTDQRTEENVLHAEQTTVDDHRRAFLSLSAVNSLFAVITRISSVTLCIQYQHAQHQHGHPGSVVAVLCFALWCEL